MILIRKSGRSGEKYLALGNYQHRMSGCGMPWRGLKTVVMMSYYV